MKPSVIAAGLLIVTLFIVAQCVVIGAMAFDSSQRAGREPAEFYRGMYYLCYEAYQGYGYPQSDVIDGCNKHVSQERDLKTHLRNAPGYSP